MKELQKLLILKTVDGKNFSLPQGRWKHIKKSIEWERNYKNEAKNVVGTFSATSIPHVLRWDSINGSITMLAEVKEIYIKGTTLYVRHRSGLEYWYERSK